jgi:hypothetical protein
LANFSARGWTVVEPASVIVPESSVGVVGEVGVVGVVELVGLVGSLGVLVAQLARTKAPAMAATDSSMAIFFKISFPP